MQAFRALRCDHPPGRSAMVETGSKVNEPDQDALATALDQGQEAEHPKHPEALIQYDKQS